jgi:hypothetical protein
MMRAARGLCSNEGCQVWPVWPICPAARCSGSVQVQKPTTQANTTSNHRRMLEPRRPARTPDTTNLEVGMPDASP